MKPTDMLIRAEIRQMLNEAGLHREGLEKLIKETLREFIEQRVDQVLKQGNLGSMENAVNKVVDRKLEYIIREYTKQIITDKLRWMKFDVNVTTDKKE
jgi:hypothetical protein